MPKFSSVKNTEYSFETYDRPLTSLELKTVGEIAVWWDYIRQRSSSSPNTALQELLRRHEKMLQYLAQSSHKQFPNNSDWEDKLQHARYGAMRAYERFDISASVRLSTYVQTIAFRHLQSSNDSDAFIECPAFARKIRNYLNGRYDGDPKKKIEVERALQINCDADRDELHQRFLGLIAKYTSIDAQVADSGDGHNYLRDIIPGEFPEADDIINSVYLDEKLNVLSERQRFVIKNFSDGLKMSKIGELLGVTEDSVRGDIQTVRRIMKREIGDVAALSS